jgi:hypothetical protein
VAGHHHRPARDPIVSRIPSNSHHAFISTHDEFACLACLCHASGGFQSYSEIR